MSTNNNQQVAARGMRRGMRRAILLIVGLSVIACTAPQPAVVATLIPATATALPQPSATLGPSPTPTLTAAPTLPPLPTITPTPSAGAAGVWLDPSQNLGSVEPFSFGTNIGPWTGVPLEMQDEVANAGLTFLRFPGGNWGDQYNLDASQIDQYIALCRQLKVEPSISVRLLNGSPDYAAAMLKYVNLSQKYAVRYWSIGNEPSLYASANRIEYDTVRYNREWRTFALALRAVDPTIKLVGPDIHQFTPDGGPTDAAGRFWLAEFLRANGDLVDVVSIHRYPFPLNRSDPEPSLDALRTNAAEWDAIIPALRATIRQHTGRDLPIAVTEVNSNWTSVQGGTATPDSFANALWWSAVLGRLIRQRVAIVAHFAIHGPTAEGWGLVENYKVRPSYYVYQMYKHFGQQLIVATSDEPLVDVVAAKRADGHLTVMITNQNAEARQKPLQIGNAAARGSIEVWRFDREHAAEALAPLAGGPDLMLDLPAESVTLLILPPQ